MHALHRFGVRPGLARIEELLRRLGNPERRGIRYLHIAGTNGKGSTGAILSSILCEAGYCTGFFSSPHLHHHCERYRVNGSPMPENMFAPIFSQVVKAIDAMVVEGWESPTEFEAVTAVALLYFSLVKVDVAVIEAGMGGLHDSTNVIAAETAIITNVGMDHMEYLGASEEAIAREKAGIIKHKAQVITAASGRALQIIQEVAAKQEADLYILDRDFSVSAKSLQPTGTALIFVSGCFLYRNLTLPLLGRHQLSNAALALKAATLLGIGEDVVRRGLAKASWPGRLEVLSKNPLVVLDGAHNEPGMRVLAEAIRSYWPQKRICCLLGMLADKQREESLAHLLPLITRVVVTPPPLLERAGDWQHIAELCTFAGVAAESVEDTRTAVKTALRYLEEDCDMLLACGSLYLIADVRTILQEAFV